jgi:hypothetical protein
MGSTPEMDNCFVRVLFAWVGLQFQAAHRRTPRDDGKSAAMW